MALSAASQARGRKRRRKIEQWNKHFQPPEGLLSDERFLLQSLPYFSLHVSAGSDDDWKRSVTSLEWCLNENVAETYFQDKPLCETFVIKHCRRRACFTSRRFTQTVGHLRSNIEGGVTWQQIILTDLFQKHKASVFFSYARHCLHSCSVKYQ